MTKVDVVRAEMVKAMKRSCKIFSVSSKPEIRNARMHYRCC